MWSTCRSSVDLATRHFNPGLVWAEIGFRICLDFVAAGLWSVLVVLDAEHFVLPPASIRQDTYLSWEKTGANVIAWLTALRLFDFPVNAL